MSIPTRKLLGTFRTKTKKLTPDISGRKNDFPSIYRPAIPKIIECWKNIITGHFLHTKEKIRDLICLMKFKVGFRTLVFYQIPPECRINYIDQTIIAIEENEQQQKRNIRLKQPSTSTIDRGKIPSTQGTKCDSNTQVLHKCGNYWASVYY